MILRVHGGTSQSGENLCLSCRYYYSRKEADNRQISFCTYNYYSFFPLFGKVVECNRYYTANLPTLEDMKKMAWVLRTGSSGHSIGFVRNKDFREKEGDTELDDLHG